jgi:hypothetical protein
MPFAYAMCFLDRAKFPVLRREFVAADDAAAISHALPFSKTHLIEVLSGERVIARIPKGSLGYGAVMRAEASERIL